MKQILFILACIISINLFGQSNKLITTKIDPDYTWRNSSLAARDSLYLNLPVLKNTNYKTFLRISMVGQTIDLFSEDNIKFRGILTNEITKYKPIKSEWGEDSKEFEIISQKIQLDYNISSIVANKLLGSGQASIPTDSLIPSWSKSYLHCNSIVFQFYLNAKYYEQVYQCPWGQSDTVEYASLIVSNYNFLKKKLELRACFEMHQVEI